MKKYSVRNKVTGVITNSWTDDKLPADHYEPGFGKPGEFEIIEEDITAQLVTEQEQAASRAYLAETDWLIIREMDTGTPCPQEIRTARQAARDKL